MSGIQSQSHIFKCLLSTEHFLQYCLGTVYSLLLQLLLPSLLPRLICVLVLLGEHRIPKF